MKDKSSFLLDQTDFKTVQLNNEEVYDDVKRTPFINFLLKEMRSPMTRPRKVILTAKPQEYVGSQGGTPDHSCRNHKIISTDCIEHTFDKNKVQLIACGEYHSMAMTVQGTVYGFGSNMHG